MKKIIDAMKWRYATNKFDTNKKLSKEQLDELLDAIILSPSSFGLQPWKFIVVTNKEIREKLKEAGYGQPKIAESSHLIVFAVPKILDDALVANYIKSVSEARNVPVENLKVYTDMITGSLSHKTMEQRVEWATRQAYIALGVLVTSGAISGIDVAPMEGFDSKKFDEILGLDKMGLESKVAVAVGFRDDTDPSLQNKKVRFSRSDVVIEIK